MIALPNPPIVALLTDFGLADGYVGVMKGVILGLAPGAQLVDLTHEIPPQDIVTGAWVLGTSSHAFPAGTIFLCVVDPGVGSARLPIALRAGDDLFVGPDNGLFSYVLRAAPASEVVVLDNPRYQRANPSATFHGRDIFAPPRATSPPASRSISLARRSRLRNSSGSCCLSQRMRATRSSRTWSMWTSSATSSPT